MWGPQIFGHTWCVQYCYSAQLPQLQVCTPSLAMCPLVWTQRGGTGLYGLGPSLLLPDLRPCCRHWESLAGQLVVATTATVFASVCARSISEGNIASSKIQAQCSQSLNGLPANRSKRIVLRQTVKPCSILNISKAWSKVHVRTMAHCKASVSVYMIVQLPDCHESRNGKSGSLQQGE